MILALFCDVSCAFPMYLMEFHSALWRGALLALLSSPRGIRLSGEGEGELKVTSTVSFGSPALARCISWKSIHSIDLIIVVPPIHNLCLKQVLKAFPRHNEGLFIVPTSLCPRHNEGLFKALHTRGCGRLPLSISCASLSLVCWTRFETPAYWNEGFEAQQLLSTGAPELYCESHDIE